MKNNKIVIDVQGTSNTGKSRLILLMKQFLREKGFEVEIQPNLDYPDEETFDKQHDINLQESIATIKDKSKVVFVETHCIRSLND